MGINESGIWVISKDAEGRPVEILPVRGSTPVEMPYPFLLRSSHTGEIWRGHSRDYACAGMQRAAMDLGLDELLYRGISSGEWELKAKWELSVQTAV